MTNPLFWLSLSIGLLALGVLILLAVAIPTLLGMARVAHSAEKLLDALHRELPPTLHSLRQTGADLSELAGDVNDGMQSASHVVKQVDQSLSQVSQQAHQAQITSQSLWTGLNVAWRVFRQPARPKRRQRPPTRRRLTQHPSTRSPQSNIAPDRPTNHSKSSKSSYSSTAKHSETKHSETKSNNRPEPPASNHNAALTSPIVPPQNQSTD